MSATETKMLVDGLVFGEAPRWHNDRLWIADMFGKRVVTLTLDGHLEEVVEVPTHPSGLGWLPDGRLLIVSMRDKQLLAYESGKLTPYADLSGLCKGTPNDMVVDSRGRAYVGNTGGDLFAGVDPQPTELVLVENGEVRVVAEQMIFPNGSVISPDGRTLIICETFSNCITAFDIDPDSGDLSGRRVFAEVGERTPDGCCLDAEGAVWFGSFMTGEFVRVVEGGEVTDVIPVDGRCGVACMTGGSGRNTLFLVSAQTTPEGLLQGESECRVETVQLSVPGAGLP